MSFSNEVKNELARLEPHDPNCDKAELLALLRMSGAIVLRGFNVGIHFSTENAALARRVLQLLKNNYQVQTEVVITRSRRLKKNNRYQVQVIPSPQVSKAMTELQLLSVEGDLKNPLLSSHAAKKNYLRGAFLGGGSVSRPNSDYHLELVTENEAFAQTLIKVLQTFSLKAKLTDRKSDFIVYLKDGESIVKFLNVVGAHSSMMELENVRIIKDMRNNVNRVVNCETANLNKVVEAALRQVQCIRYIEARMNLAELPEPLLFIARLRLQHPEASLNELVDYAGGLGKSGINHRLKKLQKLAVKLGMEVDSEAGSSASAGKGA